MRLSRRSYALSGSADGRGRVSTLTSILVLASLLVLVLAVLPAGAGEGGPSTAGVQPAEIAYGGGSGACFANFPGLWEPGQIDELHINNPASGTYAGPDGTEVTLTVKPGDKYFSFSFEDPTMAAFDVVVNGGSKNTHFDYDGNETGALSEDAELHAPTKSGNNLYKLSHINICYDRIPIADLSVLKTPVDEEGGTPDPFLVNEGDLVTYEILVSNEPAPISNSTATGVNVTDTLPDGMSFDSASGGTNISGALGTDSDGNTTYTWTGTGLDLAPDNSITLTIVLKVDDATGGQPLTNTVSVAGKQSDPTPGPDNEADSEPDVTVNAILSGTVFEDKNANSAFDAGDVPESRTVRVYGGDTPVETTSLPDGSYSFLLAPGPTYTVCLDRNDERQQTIPDLDTNPPAVPGVACDESVNEPVGYSVQLTANVSGKDFGNLPLITCGIAQEIFNDTFVSAEFKIFGNSILECGLKGLSFFFYNSDTGVPDEDGDTAAVLLDGQGKAAGRGVFVKVFEDPAGFAPLVYAPTAAQLGSAIEPSWCNVRAKAPADGDGDEFDEWLSTNDYPSLVGVVDAFGPTPEVCKVAEIETVALVDGDTVGLQTTVVYTETDDPYFR